MEIKEKSPKIDVSVIVPVYNSDCDIGRTVDALVRQDYDRSKYEIVVVDNGSTDSTPEVVKGYCEQYPGLVKLFFQNEIQSSYAARNTGITQAMGDILAFVDADMWMDESWLRLVVDEMQSMNIQYMGCRVDIQDIDSTGSLAALYDRIMNFPVEKSLAQYHYTPTCCLVTRASLFKKVGMFDASLISSGDFEFGNRVFQHGVKLHYASNILLYHPARVTLQSLKKRYIRIGKGQEQMMKRHSNLPTYERRYLFRRLLPPNLISFVKELKNRSKVRNIEVSEIQVFKLYLIHMYIKYATTIGYVTEKIFSIFQSPNLAPLRGASRSISS